MDVQWEDQQKINEYSKLDNLLTYYELESESLNERKENLDYWEMELELTDEDDELMYKVGDCFVLLKQEEIMPRLESDKDKLSGQISSLETKQSDMSKRMEELKAYLYGKFGRDSINLERK